MPSIPSLKSISDKVFASSVPKSLESVDIVSRASIFCVCSSFVLGLAQISTAIFVSVLNAFNWLNFVIAFSMTKEERVVKGFQTIKTIPQIKTIANIIGINNFLTITFI